MPDGVTMIDKLDEPSMGESSFKGRLPPLGGSPVTVKELRVGGFIVEIDGDGAVVAFGFGGLCHVSSPSRRWWVRMRHGEVNVLKWHAYRVRMGTLPRNAMECGSRRLRAQS